MHLSFHSLRTGIMAHLAVLILAAMLLINLVMVKFSENDLLQTRVETGRLIILGLEKMITYGGKTWADIESNPNLKREIAQRLRMGGFSEASMVDTEGEIVFSTGSQIYGEKKSPSLSQKVLSKKNGVLIFMEAHGVSSGSHLKG